MKVICSHADVCKYAKICKHGKDHESLGHSCNSPCTEYPEARCRPVLDEQENLYNHSDVWYKYL